MLDARESDRHAPNWLLVIDHGPGSLQTLPPCHRWQNKLTSDDYTVWRREVTRWCYNLVCSRRMT
jgi:hypothetical protein